MPPPGSMNHSATQLRLVRSRAKRRRVGDGGLYRHRCLNRAHSALQLQTLDADDARAAGVVPISKQKPPARQAAPRLA